MGKPPPLAVGLAKALPFRRAQGCDLFLAPDQRTTITARIRAMRQWQVIPNAVVFDNGSAFKGKLLSAFCANLNIRLIHAAVGHPQTNGKLERAFRDDMREFYAQYPLWLLEPLRRDLPAYVHYRNYIRGHRALGGTWRSHVSVNSTAWHSPGCSSNSKAMPAMKWDVK